MPVAAIFRLTIIVGLGHSSENNVQKFYVILIRPSASAVFKDQNSGSHIETFFGIKVGLLSIAGKDLMEYFACDHPRPSIVFLDATGSNPRRNPSEKP